MGHFVLVNQTFVACSNTFVCVAASNINVATILKVNEGYTKSYQIWEENNGNLRSLSLVGHVVLGMGLEGRIYYYLK